MTTFLWILAAVVIVAVIVRVRKSRNVDTPCEDCFTEEVVPFVPEVPSVATKKAVKKPTKKTTKKGKK